MKLILTLFFLSFYLFSFSQAWKDISYGIQFTDYVYYNNDHFGVSVTNGETNIYKLRNNGWTKVFSGSINSYKIAGDTFLVAGNFADSFNLRYFEDDTFKPLMKTIFAIQSVSVSGDSLFIEEGNSQYSSNEFYWFYNNLKTKINFTYPTSSFIPWILQSPIIINDKLYSGGIYRNYWNENILYLFYNCKS